MDHPKKSSVQRWDISLVLWLIMYLADFGALLLGLPRLYKRALVMSHDIFICCLSVWLAFYLRTGEFISIARSEPWATSVMVSIWISLACAIPIFVMFGLYRTIFRHSGSRAILTIVSATAVYGTIYFSIITLLGVVGVPRTIGIIQPLILFVLVSLSRTLASAWLGVERQRHSRTAGPANTLIYGAGRAGRQLATALRSNREMRIIGFLDDDGDLHGQLLNGLRIYDPGKLTRLVKTQRISCILLAMPSLRRQRRNQILTRIQRAHVSVRTLPSVTDLATGKLSISDIRELDVDDLLGRDPVAPHETLLTKNVLDKVVLVTGAGGSIGSELCRQIVAIRPKTLLMVEQSEFMLYNINRELKEKHGHDSGRIIPLLASIQDKNRMVEIMTSWRPDTVYHAAAYKHVPLVELNPAEGINNNVMGTLRTAEAALDSGVSDFVLVSTDKAVRPTNMMGASKRLAEMILQSLKQPNIKTRFAIVRFGNVLGSSGSVVPTFRAQIKAGGPVTLTHPDVSRYFMTIPEAAQLVLQAGALATGGDVFVLDMGEPIKIGDLARRMIDLSGFTVREDCNPDGDIAISITGLRPGEKLFEELLLGDNPEKTHHPRIMKAKEPFIAWDILKCKVEALECALRVNDAGVIASIMQELVQGYEPSLEIREWMLTE